MNQLCSYAWFGGLAYIFVGKMFLKMLSISEQHAAVLWIEENKTYFIGGLFLMNTLSAQMVASGAFEVYLNDELVYSKLATGRVPSAEDIMGAVISHGLRR